MNNYKIVPLKEEYIKDVHTIIKLSLQSSWSLSSLKNELNNNLAKYILLKKDNKIIGFAAIWIVIDQAEIINIAVHPKYRGEGYGNILLTKLIELCSKNKVNSITLEVRKSNITAQNLYKKFDFVEEGLRKGYYQDNNEDAIIMWKRNKLRTTFVVGSGQ